MIENWGKERGRSRNREIGHGWVMCDEIGHGWGDRDNEIGQAAADFKQWQDQDDESSI